MLMIRMLQDCHGVDESFQLDFSAKLSKPCDDFFGTGTEGQKERREAEATGERLGQRNTKLKIAPEFDHPFEGNEYSN